jgi:predicted glycoside hydrolase/deacetylase ChbG (UPF0249 family)
MTDERFLIVNADDFGRSAGVNTGVIKAHEQGVVTSASLMVRWPAAEAAGAYARDNPGLGLGLHLDLGEWVWGEGQWSPLYQVVDLEDPGAVESELESQLTAFRALVGRDPTHLDSHQHVHREIASQSASAFASLAERLDVPLRHKTAEIRYCGDLYGQTEEGAPLHDVITVERMIDLIRELPPGVTELVCHPGEGADHASIYAEEREQEVGVLCDPRVRAAIESEGIELASFAALPPSVDGAAR